MSDITTTMASYPVVLPFIVLILSAVTVIIGLDCVWRVEKRLKAFIILLTLGIAVTLVRKASLLLGYGQSTSWSIVVQYFDIISSLLLLAAFMNLYRIIRKLDHELK